MPFTPTHVAAIVPIAWLLRWNVPLSALAIGSMVCDLGVFFPDLFDYGIMHSMTGLATHCLPFGLVLFFIFHWLIKRPLCALLPDFVHARLVPWVRRMPSLGLMNLLIVSVCIYLGAATHVLWDSFTHGDRWGTTIFPVLNEVAISFDVKVVYWYTVLQHGSSVVFLPMLFLATCYWLARQTPVEILKGPKVPTGIKTLAFASLVVIPMLAYCYYKFGYPGAPDHIVIHEAVKLACSLLILESLLFSLAFPVLERNLSAQRIAERKL